MVEPIVSADAVDEFFALEDRERAAILNALDRLRVWPKVSGVRALQSGGGGKYRIRCGGSRIVFDIVDGAPLVRRIRHRDQVYNVRKRHRQAKA